MDDNKNPHPVCGGLMHLNRARLRPSTTSVCLAAIVRVSTAWPGATAQADGFGLIEHGASGLGNAYYAGASAVSALGSTAWFNPAGLSDFTINPGLHALLDGNQNANTQLITQNFLNGVPASAAVELPPSLSFSGAWQVKSSLEPLLNRCVS